MTYDPHNDMWQWESSRPCWTDRVHATLSPSFQLTTCFNKLPRKTRHSFPKRQQETDRSDLKLQPWNRESELEMAWGFKIWKPTYNDILLPIRSHLLNLPGQPPTGDQASECLRLRVISGNKTLCSQVAFGFDIYHSNRNQNEDNNEPNSKCLRDVLHRIQSLCLCFHLNETSFSSAPKLLFKAIDLGQLLFQCIAPLCLSSVFSFFSWDSAELDFVALITELNLFF